MAGPILFGVIQRDALGLHELDQPFAVAADIALHFGQSRKVFPVRLADVEDIHGPESVQRGLSFLGIRVRFRILIFLALVADHRSENENTFFATPDEAAKRVPSAESCNVGGIGFLPRNQHDVAEAVVAKLGHRPEVCGEHFTVTGLQSRDEEIHGLFGFLVDFF